MWKGSFSKVIMKSQAYLAFRLKFSFEYWIVLYVKRPSRPEKPAWLWSILTHAKVSKRLRLTINFMVNWSNTTDYTTIQRMTIPRLTKWRPDFDILMIQRLFFWKKRPKFFSYPSRVSLKDFSYPSRVPERTYTTPHGVFLPLAGADF